MQAGVQRIIAVVRAVARLVWLAWELSAAATRTERRALLGLKQSTVPKPSDARRSWLHHTAARVRRVLDIQPTVTGPIPARGLLVANHLSYLDIIVLAALTPCVFVAKSEVKSWPVFGWFARRGGTIFVNRASRRDAVRATEEIRAALRAGALVVLFPEGTSSDGAKVLPFKSALLEAAAAETPNIKLQPAEKHQTPSSNAAPPITVAALHYALNDGDAAREVCYWGDHTLVPHLLRLVSKRAVRASVAFASVTPTGQDRKQLAAQLHAQVSARHEIFCAKAQFQNSAGHLLPTPLRQEGKIADKTADRKIEPPSCSCPPSSCQNFQVPGSGEPRPRLHLRIPPGPLTIMSP